MTGVYEETSNGLTGQKQIDPVYRNPIDNGSIRREAMSDV